MASVSVLLKSARSIGDRKRFFASTETIEPQPPGPTSRPWIVKQFDENHEEIVALTIKVVKDVSGLFLSRSRNRWRVAKT